MPTEFSQTTNANIRIPRLASFPTVRPYDVYILHYAMQWSINLAELLNMNHAEYFCEWQHLPKSRTEVIACAMHEIFHILQYESMTHPVV